MRKLKLNPEDLAVDSFAPAPEQRERRGTVEGQEFTEVATCNFRNWTCGITCNGGTTCNGGSYDCPPSYAPTCYPVCVTGEIC